MNDGCKFCGCDGCPNCSGHPWRQCECSNKLTINYEIPTSHITEMLNHTTGEWEDISPYVQKQDP